MPLVERSPMYVGGDGFVTFVDLDEAQPETDRWQQPKDELYLRELRELDLTSDKAIADFASEHGSLGGYHWSDVVPPEWAMADGVGNEDPNEFLRLYDRWANGKSLPELHQIKKHSESREVIFYYAEFHPDEFRVRAKLIRDMTRIWQCHQGQLDITDVLLGWESDWVPERPGTVREAVEKFLLPLLNHGLRPFHQQFMLRLGEEPPKLKTTLYSALCLQLANHIAENGTYQKCALAGCESLFIRQRGRAVKGGRNRLDSHYCCERHAKNAAQREYRKREKAAKGAEE